MNRNQLHKLTLFRPKLWGIAKTILIGFMVAGLFLRGATTAWGEMQYSLALSYPYYLNDEMGITNIPSPRITAGTKNYYAWATYENAEMRKLFSSYGSVGLWGMGAGVKKGTFFIELGYYLPYANAAGTWHHGEKYWEAFAESMAARLHPLTISPEVGLNGNHDTYWPAYRYEITGAFGGTVGAELNVVNYANWKINAFGICRFLKFRERVEGFNPNYPPKEGHGYWLNRNERDVSCVMIGVNVVW